VFEPGSDSLLKTAFPNEILSVLVLLVVLASYLIPLTSLLHSPPFAFHLVPVVEPLWASIVRRKGKRMFPRLACFLVALSPGRLASQSEGKLRRGLLCCGCLASGRRHNLVAIFSAKGCRVVPVGPLGSLGLIDSVFSLFACPRILDR
jgi:hypothetical protein